jgi:hypothetical protein
MTDKKFVLSVNPTCEHNGYRLEVTPFGIFIRGGEDSELLCLPIPLKYEKNMWSTLRKIEQNNMLRKLES